MWLSNWPVWLVPGFAVVAVLSLLLRGRIPVSIVYGAFVVSLSTSASLAMVRWWPSTGGAILDAARTSGMLSLAWAVGAAVVMRRRPRKENGDDAGIDSVARTVSLLLAVVTAVLQSFVLVVRVIQVALDLGRGYPAGVDEAFGFGSSGLWALVLLAGACGVALILTRDRRLGVCQFWVGLLLVSWMSLLVPPLQPLDVGGWRRTGVMLVWLSSLSLVTIGVVLITQWLDRRCRSRLSLSQPHAAVERNFPWPGLPMAVFVVGVLVLLLACYQLVVPISIGIFGYRGNALIVALSTALTGVACLLIVRVSWRRGLAEIALALLTLSICSLATLAVPSRTVSLTERYPMIFNAVMVGLAISLAFWTRLVDVWRRKLKDGQAQTTAGRLIKPITRFAFFNGAMALVVGMAMAFWPRWPGIAVMDDTLGRVSAGLAGNLLLLLVMLWCSRRLLRTTFQILTVLAVLSGAAFLLARMIPFTPQFGP